MIYFRSLRKISALAAVALILPAMAYAGHDNGKGNGGENKVKGNGKGVSTIPVVPEANVGWVLVPFLGAVLFFSARQIFPKKATK